MKRPLQRVVVRAFYRMALRLKMLKTLRSFFPLWANSNAVYIGPVGPFAVVYPEVVALRQVIRDPAITDANLYHNLFHSNEWIVGYCFEALLARKSPLLERLPAALKRRSETIHLGLTCLVVDQPLHAYVTNRCWAERKREPIFSDAVQE